MPSSTAVDVAIGLAFVFFILSVVVSAIHETIATVAGRRATYLRKGLVNILLHDPGQIVDAAAKIERAGGQARGLVTGAPAKDESPPTTGTGVAKDEERIVHALLSHPLIAPMVQFDKDGKPHKRSPSYLPSRTFVATILSIAREELAATKDAPAAVAPDLGPDASPAERRRAELMAELRRVLDHVPGDRVNGAFKALHERADDVAHFEALAEQWYDDSMERVSGWYKRRAQLWIWALGLLLAVALNADSIRIGRALWTEKSVRDAVVQQARRVTLPPETDPKTNKPLDQLQTAARSVSQVEKLKVPMGWSGNWPPKGTGWFTKFLGLLLTGAALSLGAPFWFDLLSKVARLRSSGAPPPATKAVRHGEGEETRAGAGATV